jgi:ABC-type Fe3+/spermidine/putrescine transport system ATPase subunit
MGAIVLDHLSKVFPNGFKAIDDISLTIEDGEFMVLVGPSGCGKSSCSDDRGPRGVSAARSRSAAATSAARRGTDIAMVFQNYALYLHMDVRRNLGYGLRVRRTPAAEVKPGRGGGEAPRPREAPRPQARCTSGGQRQRVAMGRATSASRLRSWRTSRSEPRREAPRRHARARACTSGSGDDDHVTHDQVRR